MSTYQFIANEKGQMIQKKIGMVLTSKRRGKGMKEAEDTRETAEVKF